VSHSAMLVSASEVSPEGDRRHLALLGCHDVNAARYLGHLLTVTLGALRLRFFVLSERFGTLEGIAAFLTTVLVGWHLSPPQTWNFRSDGSNEITLPQFNAAMPQNVVSGGAMEIKVRHHEVH
jgi:hypothetical protein